MLSAYQTQKQSLRPGATGFASGNGNNTNVKV